MSRCSAQPVRRGSPDPAETADRRSPVFALSLHLRHCSPRRIRCPTRARQNLDHQVFVTADFLNFNRFSESASSVKSADSSSSDPQMTQISQRDQAADAMMSQYECGKQEPDRTSTAKPRRQIQGCHDLEVFDKVVLFLNFTDRGSAFPAHRVGQLLPDRTSDLQFGP